MTPRPAARKRTAAALPADQALRRLLAQQWAVVLRNDERMRQGSAAGLHDIRIALRRMRTLTATFQKLDAKALKRLDKQLAKMCDDLGDIRDLDVWMELFRQMDKSGELQDIPVKERRDIIHAFQLDRANMAGRVMEGKRYDQVKKKTAAYLAAGRIPRRDRLPSVVELAARRTLIVRALVAERYKRVGNFSKGPAHDLRRAGRRLRYLTEFFAADMGPEFIRAGHWITKAQSALGKVHDCDSALLLLRVIPSGGTRKILRRALQQRRRAQLDKFKTAWARYADKRLQEKWEARLRRQAE